MGGPVPGSPEVNIAVPFESRHRRAALWIAIAGFCMFVTALACFVARSVATASLRDTMGRRIDLYAANLESEMRRYEYLPPVVAFHPDVMQVLARPADPASREQANRYLETVTAQTGASAIYVMDRSGKTLAASNWQMADSFVGRNFAYRPYFQEAATGLAGRFYGIGNVSREPGYYFAHGIQLDGPVIGVAAVKVNLDKLDRAWDNSSEKVLVVDGNGVVFLSSELAWKFKTLRNLSRETIGELAATRQYSEAGQLAPLGLNEERRIDDATTLAQLTSNPATASQPYMVHAKSVPGTDWQLLILADTSPISGAVRYTAAFTALICGLVIVATLYVRQRYQSVAQAVQARENLQRANDQLESTVERRTEALIESNRQLQSEIGERELAERTLKATLQDLVHTAKMAVLGQMSASITHELNQPLTALQTLSDNAATLLDRGRPDEARENLRMIGRTAARMGTITGQLRKFARRSDMDIEPVQLNTVINDALFLLKQSLRARDVLFRVSGPPSIHVACNANRLEQVLVNLLTNAADAVDGFPTQVIEVAVVKHHDCVRVEIHDSGPGIDATVAPHLFEPLFTTKEQGVGLGLGLAISNDIVRHFGGGLTFARSDRLGGAVFVVELVEAIKESSDA
ncbi:ATP-binding protein [soil metagenome]